MCSVASIGLRQVCFDYLANSTQILRWEDMTLVFHSGWEVGIPTVKLTNVGTVEIFYEVDLLKPSVYSLLAFASKSCRSAKAFLRRRTVGEQHDPRKASSEGRVGGVNTRPFPSQLTTL